MQYHFDGFRSGDPDIQPSNKKTAGKPDRVDVLIVGCGPAGLTLAAQMAAFPDITTRIVERKPGRLEIGQADGIACRSMEMFEAFGFAEKVAREAYWVNETSFWQPAANGTDIERGSRIQDVEDDLSEMPHTILSQARVHDFYLDVMRNSASRLEPSYNLEFASFEQMDGDPDGYPLLAKFRGLNGAADETIRAKYIVGCDGARSGVRRAMGYQLKGEAARQLWGVMDVLAVTDFPDIRLKCAIQSAGHGSLIIIPREGGYMVRLYIELDVLEGDERATDRGVTAEMLRQKVNDILSPYTLDLREVAWCSAYEIGQRVCDSFDDLSADNSGDQTPRIFIAGDACHTHSPKAGQGMNVSMADTFNLGWKLASVIRRQAAPGLLNTYSQERRAKARELIDFDRELAGLISSRKKSADAAKKFQDYFQKHGRYTAGVETRYDPSLVIGNDTHQHLAAGLKIGMRFHSAPVVRLADAKPMQLGHALKADGRWRLIAFAPAGDVGQPDGAIAGLCDYLQNDADSPLRRCTPADSDLDSVIDLRAVFQLAHRDLQLQQMPSLVKPSKGRLGLTDYEKIFAPDLKNGPDIFDQRQIDRQRGALVLVRPDQFVAQVLPLEDRQELADFFAAFMLGDVHG
ncbi:MAG: FAD-dependent monooxygenase [Rhizobiaceae bacterium]